MPSGAGATEGTATTLRSLPVAAALAVLACGGTDIFQTSSGRVELGDGKTGWPAFA